MNTDHRLLFRDSRCMEILDEDSIELVVTSPPYPMIEMWDATFARMNGKIAGELEARGGWAAYQLMHAELDKVWKEVCRVLKPGGIACINIGDAVRKIGESFFLYPNHARIIHAFTESGLSPLPAVIWRKQTNAPNKFMGSGMLPAGAYVTLEHEYILIFRKGGGRRFKTEQEKLNRHRSAIFWEERNQWFSDIWFDLKGARQQLADEKVRKRSGAYPFELPYRLINMYSVMGDTVLDPFAGMGTSLFAAMAAGRNSVGMEIEEDFYPAVKEKAGQIVNFANTLIRDRLKRHLAFVAERQESGKPFKHVNSHYGFPVVTGQEKQLVLHSLKKVDEPEPGHFTVDYSQPAGSDVPQSRQDENGAKLKNPVQQSLFEI
ncbi:MAG: site-specific DNA-methyltransferase [Desulfobacterales bacterium]|nr:site-specific DNA-methyltransferase [Desulfobacterales bacterium]